MNLLIEILFIVGLVVITLSSLSSALSLLFEVRFWKNRGRGQRQSMSGSGYPSVTVIMPVRGLDQDLRNNIASVLNQDYPGPRNYIFVLDDENDPTYNVITNLLSNRNVNAKVLINRGGRSKGEALAFGLGEATGDVVVLVDSDAQVHELWLKNLVEALMRGFGAATTYRFYLPLRRLSLGSVLRASFNMIGITAMQNPTARFTWGGSSAVWRWLIEKWSVRDYLPYYLSDDYVITHFVHREGLGIEFVPESLVLTLEDVGLREAFSWAVRQLWYVRVYGFKGFMLYAASYTLYAITLPMAATLLIINTYVSILGVLPYLLGMVKDYVRVSGIRGLNKYYRERITRRYAVLLALASVPNVYFSWLAIIKTTFTNSINWRGRVFTVNDAVRLMREKPLP